MHEIKNEQRAIYLRELLLSYGKVRLPLEAGLSFSLVQVFQPLRLRFQASHEQQEEASQHSQQQSQHEDELFRSLEDVTRDKEPGKPAKQSEIITENGIEALKKSPHGRLVILGSPGTGKTTVLKHLLCYHAQLALEDSHAPLPIFLSLPDLARTGLDLESYLVQFASTLYPHISDSAFLVHAIGSGKAFVCLDSLDEVLPRLRPSIIRLINHLAAQPGNSWIVGSRFTDYKGGQFQQGQFQEWELQALDKAGQLRLATQLLPELSSQLALSMFPNVHLDGSTYVQALAEHRQAATWGENPLLFSLGAVVYLLRGNLAGSRAMLYHEVLHALLETRTRDPRQRVFLQSLLAFQILQEIHPAIIPEIMHEARTLLQGGEPGRFFRSLSLSCMAEAMGEAKQATPELLARLSELLDWPHWEVRMKAAQALGKLRRNVPDAAIRRLLALRHDPYSRAVCEAVDEALAEILSLETGIEDD